MVDAHFVTLLTFRLFDNIICIQYHSYGNWDLVRSSMRRCDRFRFDFYIQACTAEALGKRLVVEIIVIVSYSKNNYPCDCLFGSYLRFLYCSFIVFVLRCELLMRAAEREVNEMEKKKQAVDALAVSNARPKDLADVNKTKLESLIKEIRAESHRLSLARTQLQTLKSSNTKAKAEVATTSKLGSSSSSASSSKEVGASTTGGTKKTKSSTPSSSSSSSSAASTSAPAPLPAAVVEALPVSKFGGPRAFPIPNHMLPELCRFVLLMQILSCFSYFIGIV